jgi:hypothetical protein
MPSGWIIIQPICEDNFMKFLADENFPLKSVHILQESGIRNRYKINSYRKFRNQLMWMSCSLLLVKGKERYSHLIAILVNWFLSLVIKPQNGILYFRWDSFQPHDPANFLLANPYLMKKLTIRFFLLSLVGTVSDKGRLFDPYHTPGITAFLFLG